MGIDIDVTFPSTRILGSAHPLKHFCVKLANILRRMGYIKLKSIEIESKKYNFFFLNIDENHPALGGHDTFFLNDGRLLRTHATNMTARVLEKLARSRAWKERNYGFFNIGNVYRRDTDDATHSHQFMQLDMVCVGKKNNLNMSHLKWTIKEILTEIFAPAKKTIRFRSSYFPFTNPSLEVDIKCHFCLNERKSDYCRFCKNSGWVEILGAGMVERRVYEKCGFKDSDVGGFAIGMGIDRIVAMALGVKDIRDLYKNDFVFLRQFELLE